MVMFLVYLNYTPGVWNFISPPPPPYIIESLPHWKLLLVMAFVETKILHRGKVHLFHLNIWSQELRKSVNLFRDFDLSCNDLEKTSGVRFFYYFICFRKNCIRDLQNFDTSAFGREHMFDKQSLHTQDAFANIPTAA